MFFLALIPCPHLSTLWAESGPPIRLGWCVEVLSEFPCLSCNFGFGFWWRILRKKGCHGSIWLTVDLLLHVVTQRKLDKIPKPACWLNIIWKHTTCRQFARIKANYSYCPFLGASYCSWRGPPLRPLGAHNAHPCLRLPLALPGSLTNAVAFQVATSIWAATRCVVGVLVHF